MEHELGEQTELWSKAEARGIVGLIIGKLGAKADQTAIDPAQDVGRILGLGSLDGQAGHKDGGRLLVERELDGAIIVGGWSLASNTGGSLLLLLCDIVPWAAEGGSAKTSAAVGVLISGKELDEATLALGKGGGPGIGNVEVDRHRRAWVDATQAPSICSTLANLDI